MDPAVESADVPLRRRVTRRVRDALWRMRDPDDMSSLLATIRQGLLDLGVPLLYTGVNVVDTTPDTPDVISHSMNPDGEWKKLHSVGAATVFGFWRARDIVYRRDLAHDDPYGEADLFPGVACIIDVPFRQGTLAASSRTPNAFSDAHVEWLQDMADLLEDGIRRMYQLRAMAARRRLGEQVWSMRGTKDLEGVMVTLRESLHRLGIHHSNCGINLLEDGQVRAHNMQSGSDWDTLQVGPQPLIESFWRSAAPVYRPDLDADDPYGERELIRDYYGKPARSVIDVPFSHGTLAINSTRPHAYDDDQVEWLVYLAEGLTEGFRRADDLNELEQHNRKLEREIAERQRAEEELKDSLAEKDVLLKEVHHRVKNNLQVVSSLLSLRANSIDDAQAQLSFDESRAQIESMAFIHEHLYEAPDLGQIDCGEYIRSLAEHVFASYGADRRPIELNTRVSRQVVDVDTAIHCGLLLQELLSNSLKYAFPANRPGRIEVGLASRAAGTVTLSVRDDGVGLPAEVDLSAPQSLGLSLITDLTRQLQGSLEHDGGDGTGMTVTFPVESHG